MQSKKANKLVTVNDLSNFFHSLIAPALETMQEENRKEHKEMRNEMKNMREELVDYIKEHETRIRKLEKATLAS